MIDVKVNKIGKQIKMILVSGHADSAPYGKDLVCAAVSAISLTGINAIIMEGLENDIYSETRSGYVDITIYDFSNDKLQNMLTLIANQLKSLAIDNKQYINYEEVNI